MHHGAPALWPALLWGGGTLFCSKKRSGPEPFCPSTDMGKPNSKLSRFVYPKLSRFVYSLLPPIYLAKLLNVHNAL